MAAVSVALAVTLVAGAGAASAATTFSDGFESGDYSAWTTVQTGADGSATVQSAVVKTGTEAARLSATAAAGSFAYARKSLTSAQTDLTVTGDFQVQAEGPGGGNVPIFRLFDPTSTKVVSLYRQNGGSGGIWVWYDNTYNATFANLPLNTWAQLQVHVVVTGAATGTVDVSLNGTSVYHASTATISSAGIASVQIGNNTSSQTFTIIADNIVVADGTSATAPTNTVRPSVSGTAQQGQTLTADPGSWSGTQPINYAYQWRQCTSTGASCVDIVGATATTYVPGPADVGHALRVFVTASNTVGSTTLGSLPTAAVSGTSATAPTNTVRPSVSGTAQQGQTLTADPGSWSGTQPINYAYQWRQCTSTGASCVDIVGQTATTYVPGPGDVGHALRVFVTASNAGGSATLGSLPTAAVSGTSGTAPVNTSPPTISGTAQAGQTLTAAPGTWTGTAPITYSYLWQRCDSAGANCASIGVTTGTYALTGADVDHRMRVVVTAANGVAPNGTATSNPTAVVQASTAGLAALWHMDETSGTSMNDAVGSHTGTLHSVQVGQPGYLGTAYGFGGSGYVSVPSAADLNPGSKDITITIHLKTTSAPASPDWDLIRKGLYTTSGGEFKMEYQPSGQASCGFKGSSGYSELIAGPSLKDGRWHTVQCVKTSSAIKVVVDGQTFTQAANVGSIANSEAVVIGARPGSEFFQGSLDEASIKIG